LSWFGWNSPVWRSVQILSTVVLRVVLAVEKATRCLEMWLGNCVPAGYIYRYLILWVGKVWNLINWNMVMRPAGLIPEKVCSGLTQQQL
jgi:hypothetical protein